MVDRIRPTIETRNACQELTLPDRQFLHVRSSDYSCKVSKWTFINMT